jgi:hypothetical protein
MRLTDVARHGVVSTADARALGIGTDQLRRLAREGALLRLVRGWYAVAPDDGQPPPWLDQDRFVADRNLHRLRTAALLRSFEGRAVASHQSAVLLHSGRLWRSDLSTVHLSRTGDDHSRHRSGAVLHPRIDASSVTGWDGLSTLPMALAVVQVGLVPISKREGPDPLESLIAVDGALHDKQITQAQLEAAIELHRGHPHIHGVRLLLAHADGRHESVGETRTGHVLRCLGYAVTPQVPVVVRGVTRRGDFGIKGTDAIVEFDGLSKYSGGFVSADPAVVRRALAEEKARQSDLEDAGKELARVGWADLDHPALIKDRVDRAIGRAGLRRRSA